MPPGTRKSSFAVRLEKVQEMMASGAGAADIRHELGNLSRAASGHKERRAIALWLLGIHLAAQGQWKKARECFAKGAELSQDKYRRAECLYALARLNYICQRDLSTAYTQAMTAAKLSGGYVGCGLPIQAEQLAQDIARERADPCQDTAKHLQHVLAEVIFRPQASRVVGKAE